MTDANASTPTPPSTEPLPRRRRRGFFWPILLIFFGSVFLLGNFGLLSPSSGLALARLWPLILVIVGIDLLLARRMPLAAVALELGVVAAGLGLALVPFSGTGGPSVPFVFSFSSRSFAPGQATVSVARDASSRTLSLTVRGGGGHYRISGGAIALVEASSDRDDLVLTTRRSTDRVEATIQQSDAPFVSAASVGIRVASEIPLSLRLEAGAGDFTVDLRDTATRDVRLAVGASTLLVTLPKPTGDVSVRIDSGATSVIIEVPDGVEARITSAGGFVSFHSANPRVPERGSSGQTAGYGGAVDRVSVTVNGGATSVTVR